MKLKEIELTNFRCFEHLTVGLESDVTAVIGVNAAGKTALLDAVALALLPLLAGTPLLFGERGPDRADELRARTGIALVPEDVRKSPTPKGGVSLEKRTLTLSASARSTETKDSGEPWTIEWSQTGMPSALMSFLESGRAEVTWRTPQGLEASGVGLHARDAQGGPGVHFDIPALAYYRDRRNCPLGTEPASGTSEMSPPTAAFFRAFDAASDFASAQDWFFTRENEELRVGRDRGDTGFELADLRAVRTALGLMLDGIFEVSTDGHTARLRARRRDAAGGMLTLELSQLSAGQRNLLALTLDFARRLVLANPRAHEPLSAPGILIVDEIELNLHPRWQQQVIPRLRRVFPNTQIIVATHSPQVLSTLEARQIRVLEDGRLFQPAMQTFGSDAARVQRLVMDTDSRPPGNAYVEDVNRLFDAIAEKHLDEAEALLATLLVQRGSDDPDLIEARMLIDNRKWEEALGP